MHKEILERALAKTIVSSNLDVDQFQNMVGHLIVPQYLSFTKNGNISLQHPHNNPLLKSLFTPAVSNMFS